MSDPFDTIKLKELKAICDFVGSSEGDADYIEQKSSVYSRNSREHIEFLLAIDLIRKEAGRYHLLNKSVAESFELAALKRAISDLIVQSKGPYGKALHSFIQKFERSERGIIYRPSNTERIMHSGTRNFLMELDILDIREESGEYVLDETYATYIYVKSSEYGLVNFERNLERQHEIGLEAELLVIRYEIDRLAKYSVGDLNVVHVSQTDVSAGYDIRSLTYLVERSEYVPRYIEVKVTASAEQRFFWTRNEISKAQELRENYFLYLVPVRLDVGLDIAGLVIIRDPFVKILQTEEWVLETEVLRVCKQQRSCS